MSFLLSSRTSSKRPAARCRTTVRLELEALEDRSLPSGGYLLVSSTGTDNVLRYSEATGAFVDEFVTHKSGGLNAPAGLIFGPRDHNLYVAPFVFDSQSVANGQLREILRYNGASGAFMDQFTASGHLNSARAVLFGPDGNLYVDDGDIPGQGRVVRFDGTTGAYVDNFVAAGSGGLSVPIGMVFGPDGKGDDKLDLYVASVVNSNVLRYDGTTGAFLGEYVHNAGFAGIEGITFGPDGRLYVASAGYGGGPAAVFRLRGPSEPNPGALIDTFVPPGTGGLLNPISVIFGPDGNGDSKQDLYVGSGKIQQSSFQNYKNTSTIKRYDGVTGAFIDTIVTTDSGGLRGPFFMIFTETDPTTLAYTGTGKVSSTTASSSSLASLGSMLTASLAPAPAPNPTTIPATLPVAFSPLLIAARDANATPVPATAPLSRVSHEGIDQFLAELEGNLLADVLGADWAFARSS